jgi:hypothetical protein
VRKDEAVLQTGERGRAAKSGHHRDETEDHAAMTIHAKTTASLAGIPAAEQQARVDLAAVYRLCAHYGWGDVIYNHCAMRVPGEDSKFLMKRHETLWTEVTAIQSREGRHA